MAKVVQISSVLAQIHKHFEFFRTYFSLPWLLRSSDYSCARNTGKGKQHRINMRKCFHLNAVNWDKCVHDLMIRHCVA